MPSRPTNTVQAKPIIPFTQIFGIVIVIAWAITWYWIQDQTNRLRALELSFGKAEAALTAVQPFAAADRVLLTTVATSVSKQEDNIKYLTATVDEMNKLLQIVGKDQIALRNQYEILKDTLQVKRTK